VPRGPEGRQEIALTVRSGIQNSILRAKGPEDSHLARARVIVPALRAVVSWFPDHDTFRRPQVSVRGQETRAQRGRTVTWPARE